MAMLVYQRVSYLSYSTDIVQCPNLQYCGLVLQQYEGYIHLAKLQILCVPEKRFQSYGLTPIFIQSLWMTMT